MSSSSEKPEEFTDEGPDELLVAYLDGQLDAEECERLESRLANDEPTRERLQTLDRVWNALDALPRSTASPAFTRSTVEMAAVTAAGSVAKPSSKRRWRPPTWLLSCGVAAVLGAMLTWTFAAMPERRALRDLPVALHASALEQAGSIEFLGAFAASSQPDLEAFRSEDLTRDAEEWGKLATALPPERSDWVAALSPAELATVNERLAAYQTKPTAKRLRLTELSDELAAKPNTSELRETALVYAAMVERLPASEQLRLRQTDTDKRLRLIERQAPKWAWQQALEMTDEEKQRFRRAIETAAKDGGFARSLEDRFPGMMPRARDLVRDRPLAAPLRVTEIVAYADRRRPLPFARGGRGERAELMFERIVAAWRDWVDEIREGLPDRIQRMLSDAESDEQRARLLLGLLRETGISDLGATFAELPDGEIDDLLLLPREDFTAQLSDQVIGVEAEPWQRGARPGFGRPPGPPPGYERFRDRDPPEGRRGLPPRGDR
ncbi:MAG: hypothetical protein AAF266_12970 [Planctomycetota bacterium]